MLSLLYIAESKTQVYGALHDYLSMTSSIFSDLNDFICRCTHSMVCYIIFAFHFNDVENIGYVCYKKKSVPWKSDTFSSANPESSISVSLNGLVLAELS